MTRFVVLLVGCGLLTGCNKESTPIASSEPSPGGASGDNAPGAAVVVPVPAVPALPVGPVLPKGWVEFHHPDGAFTVHLPTQPKPSKAHLNMSLRQSVPEGQMVISAYDTDNKTGFNCSLNVTIFSPELVDSIRGTGEKHELPGYKPVRKSVTWAGHPSTEDTIENTFRDGTKQLTIGRNMWIGNRLYYCSLSGLEPGRPTAEEAAAVFDSFVPEK
jgi:hypothetical protein